MLVLRAGLLQKTSGVVNRLMNKLCSYIGILALGARLFSEWLMHSGRLNQYSLARNLLYDQQVVVRLL
jgi:hypothetical protein